MGGSRRLRPIEPVEFKRLPTCHRYVTPGDPVKETIMLLILLLVVLLFAAAPAWPYSRRWGYFPSGTLGAVLVVVIALMLLGQFRL